jgi:hypothetical protein
MVFSWRKFKRRIRFLIQLLILTILFYYSLNLIARWMDPMEKYRMPNGHSMKVFQQEVIHEQQTIKERLLMFYWLGE